MLIGLVSETKSSTMVKPAAHRTWMRTPAMDVVEETFDVNHKESRDNVLPLGHLDTVDQ